MAELVLGVGSSHSPMVSLDGEDWLEWGRGDHRHSMLYTVDGVHVSYEQQLERSGATVADRATVEQCRRGAGRVQTAMSTLRAAVAAADIDILIIIGDDQDEHLLADNLPPFLVYWGSTMTNGAVGDADDRPPVVKRFLPGYKEPDRPREYPVADGFASYLIDVGLDHHFDLASSNALPDPERGMGHAFGFPMRRLAADDVAIVPIMVNTYNPPSQPRVGRCRDFGLMIRSAIDAYPGRQRFGVVASGGLSHFVVHEELDNDVLAAFERRDLDALCAIPEATFVAGTSEIKNWVTAGAVCHDHDFELVDYVPGYRTPAGTGTGLAFALWHPVDRSTAASRS